MLKEAKYKKLRKMMSHDFIEEQGQTVEYFDTVGKCVEEWGMNVGDTRDEV